jgi:hypothetical protein
MWFEGGLEGIKSPPIPFNPLQIEQALRVFKKSLSSKLVFFYQNHLPSNPIYCKELSYCKTILLWGRNLSYVKKGVIVPYGGECVAKLFSY